MPANKSQDLPLQFIKGIGPQRAQALAQCGIISPADLLYCFPRTYVTHRLVPTLSSLKVVLKKQISVFNDENIKSVNQQPEYTIIAQITNHKEHSLRMHKKLLTMELSDGSGSKAYIRFWSYTEFYKKLYPEGTTVILSGKPAIDSYNKISFDHPDIQKFDFEDQSDYDSGKILPIYKLNEKLTKAHLTTRILRKIIQNTIESHLERIPEILSDEFRTKFKLEEIHKVIQNLHFPLDLYYLDKCRRRLKFEEIFFYELNLAFQSNSNKNEYKGVIISPRSNLARELLEQLSFELTGDQKKVIRDIVSDFNTGNAMNRLLQGDVGSGKTIVALLTMLSVIEHGYQVAFMAPTEVLAEQHYNTIVNLTKELDINIVALTGGTKQSDRKIIFEKISKGEANIIVGTHALFASKLPFHKLAYIVIDEQHKFGVEQRSELITAAGSTLPEDYIPHVLVMSATPIPRTLSMTLYGELDVSVIKEMPKNRIPIITKLTSNSKLEQVFEFIKKKIDAGEQAYVVYPLVDKSEKLELKSAIEHYDMLTNGYLSGYNCGLLHGQMKWPEKEQVMKDFLDKKYQILISTTVIEVGIDVPNASVMVIENAERFGLSQLHQLRGRVGRGSKQSYCVLVSNDKLISEISGKNLREDEKRPSVIRLKTMERTNDGFEIAEVDLKLRGPGDLLGTRQSGLPDFKYIDLVNDGEIITEARKIAFEIVKNPNFISSVDHGNIIEEYNRRFGKDSFYRIA